MKKKLENFSPPSFPPPPSSYSEALQVDGTAHLDRIDKLEYLNSEEERKSRIKQIFITHPSIKNEDPNLESQAAQFLSQQLNMDRREIDANMVINKSSRDHTLLLNLSDIRFKKSIYGARKRIFQAQQNAETRNGLYINENLTSYNFKLLMSLKRERKERVSLNKPVFQSVYTYEGKVYVIKVYGSPNSDALHIKNPKMLKDFLNDIDSV